MRSRRRSALVGVCIAFCALSPVIADEPRVRPNQTIADLLGEKGRPAEARGPAPPESSGLAGKLAIWAGVLIAGACALGWLRRAGKGRGAPGWNSGGVEVAGRVLLSHKHSVFVLRVGGKRLALGVAGDRLTPLGMWDEAQDSPLATDRAPPAQERTGGFTIRPQDREAMSAASSLRDTDFLPYRKQVERLRGLLRGLRPEENQDSSTEETRP